MKEILTVSSPWRAAIKPFAQQMITDHQKTSIELKQLIESGQEKATLGATTSSAHHDAR
ncbi:DUF4142 domain-containing protein [Agrobacterium radiobacter]|uniref:DUF4142 domain-containing protein n=1 Tax=Agrobacterium radiobacter TaxID=362 RepID=UPI003CE535E3